MLKTLAFPLGFGILLLAFTVCSSNQEQDLKSDQQILSYTLNPRTQKVHFFWKDKNGKIFGNAKNLKHYLKTQNKTLLFAMNGGMYNRDQSPQGLHIEKGVEKAPLDTLEEGYGNFYLQPNGLFYLTKEGTGHVCSTSKFQIDNTIQYATQSGPMLLIDGAIHPKFRAGSSNLHIRNGVGILPDGQILFAMSKDRINFFDFAHFFKNHGCQNALYLDGFVSRTYLPVKDWVQEDGNFGVIIAEIGDY